MKETFILSNTASVTEGLLILGTKTPESIFDEVESQCDTLHDA